MNKNRRLYSKEFKVDAFELLLRSNTAIKETVASLGISADLLGRWRKEYVDSKATYFPGKGHLKTPEEEQRRKLERELRRVTEEQSCPVKNKAGLKTT